MNVMNYRNIGQMILCFELHFIHEISYTLFKSFQRSFYFYEIQMRCLALR